MKESIEQLEERLLNKIENPFGKILHEIAQDFDIAKDFAEKDPEAKEKELMDEFVKGVKYMIGNQNYDHQEVKSKILHIQKTVYDMMKHDKKYLEKFLDVGIEYKCKESEDFKRAFDSEPKFVRDVNRCLFEEIIKNPQKYDTKEKHLQLEKSIVIKITEERNEKIKEEIEKNYEKFKQKKQNKPVDYKGKDFNHNKITEEYNKLKLKHPEYDERKLLEMVFSKIEKKNITEDYPVQGYTKKSGVKVKAHKRGEDKQYHQIEKINIQTKEVIEWVNKHNLEFEITHGLGNEMGDLRIDVSKGWRSAEIRIFPHGGEGVDVSIWKEKGFHRSTNRYRDISLSSAYNYIKENFKMDE